MYHRNLNQWKSLLEQGVDEDGGNWDWTTLGVSHAQTMTAQLLAKSDGLWAGDGLVAALEQLSQTIQSEVYLKDGEAFTSGKVIARFRGHVNELLIFERPFLNLIAYVSGIATKTSRVVRQVQTLCPQITPRVAMTRKTLPRYRDLAIHGVRTGGGSPHRVTLSGGVLIKENHITVAGGVSKAILGVQQVAPHSLKIVIEVRNLVELEQALKENVEGVLLDNFSHIELKKALHRIRSCSQCRPLVEVSGGIHEGNLDQFALPGVDILSIGCITHSVVSLDFSWLLIDES